MDDDPETIETLKIFLEAEGHEVTFASTGQEAVKKAVASPHALMLLDINLPDVSGLEVLQKVKKMDPQLPVVMMTAYKEADRVIDCFRMGAADCVLKPFNFDYLRMSVLTKARAR